MSNFRISSNGLLEEESADWHIRQRQAQDDEEESLAELAARVMQAAQEEETAQAEGPAQEEEPESAAEPEEDSELAMASAEAAEATADDRRALMAAGAQFRLAQLGMALLVMLIAVYA